MKVWRRFDEQPAADPGLVDLLRREEVVRKAVAALLRPWLDDTASRFQKAVASSGLPTPTDQGPMTAEPGEVLLFADGLRYDVARQLQKELEVRPRAGWRSATSITAAISCRTMPDGGP